jgi:hypothetical protein
MRGIEFLIGRAIPDWAAPFIGRMITLPDGRQKKCNCVAMLEDAETGQRRYIPGANLVTSLGDRWYAESVVDSETWQPGFMRLGTCTNAGSKASVDVASYATASGKAIDAGYPRTADNDTDNTSGGVTVVTWRTSWTTAEANVNSISEFSVCDSGTTTPTKALNHALFAAPFNKTSNDSLKVFANHVFLGS